VAHVASFEIYGLAGRPKVVRHRLHSDVNVFWGFNGSGKTSLLKILHSALRGDAASLLLVPFEAAVVTIENTSGGGTVTRSLEKSQISPGRIEEVKQRESTDNDVILRFLTNVTPSSASTVTIPWQTKPESESTRQYPHGYLPISRVSESRSRARGFLEVVDEASFDKLFANQIKTLWKDYNQQATSLINQAQDRGLAQILRLIFTASDEDQVGDIRIDDENEAYRMVREFLSAQRAGRMLKLSRARFLERYRHNPLAQQVVAEVANIQKLVDRALEPQHEVEQLISRLYLGDKRLVFRGDEVVIQSRDGAIPLEALSSGEKQLLQILLEFLAARSNAVLIDEPELSMHVDWQNQLIRNIRIVNDQAQIIMATHSPEIMAHLSDRHIFEL
jgi:energy-coupling factor transporter ATP-binding protein EcfA2